MTFCPGGVCNTNTLLPQCSACDVPTYVDDLGRCFKRWDSTGEKKMRGKGGTSKAQKARGDLKPNISKRSSQLNIAKNILALEDVDMSSGESPRGASGSRNSVARNRHKPFTKSRSLSSVVEYVKSPEKVLHKPPVPTFVEISNIPSDINPRELVEFLKLKSQKPFHLMSSIQYSSVSKTCHLHIKNKAQAFALQSLSGIYFHNQKLNIRVISDKSIIPELDEVVVVDTSTNNYNDHHKSILKAFVVSNSCYNPELHYVDLSNLSSKLGAIKVDFGNRVFCSSLLSAIKGNIADPIVALNLSQNSIFSLKYFPESAAEELFKSIRFMNLDNNNFHRLHELLDYIGKHFPILEHLSLFGNYDLISGEKKLKNSLLKREDFILAPEKIDNLISYFKRTMSKLPSLKILDQISLQNYHPLLKPSDGAPSQQHIKSSWFDLPTTAETVQSFITQYFSIFDSSRPNMNQIYDEDSVFSVKSINLAQTMASVSATSDAYAILGLWSEYIKSNRSNISSLYACLSSQPSQLAYKGIKEISKFALQYPTTRHLLESFVVDCWQAVQPLALFDLPSEVADEQVPTLTIILIGKMQEIPLNAVTSSIIERTFMRIFILLPSKPGSVGQLAGWPVRVFYDRWYHIETTASPDNSNSPLSFIHSPEDMNILEDLSETKRSVLLNFSQTTNLRLAVALQCLSQNHWVFADAQKAFDILRSRKKFQRNDFKQ